MNGRNIAIGAILLLLVAAAVFTRGFGLLETRSDKLTLYGNVDIRQVDLAFRVPWRVNTIVPEEGERVSRGQILAQLDARPLQDAVAAAASEVGIAQAELNKAEHGSRPEEISQAQAQVDEARADLQRAKQDYDRRSSLVGSGAISRQQFENTAADYRAAQARTDRATQALQLARAGSRAEDRSAAEARLAAAQAQRNAAETTLADGTLTSPNAGIILTRAREPGAIVAAGETVLTLTIDRPMRLRAYIGARDLSRISPGMKITARADGNGKTYEGRISQISPRAEFTPKTVQTEDLRADLVYRVQILVDRPDDALRQGQPVTILVPGARRPSDN